MKGSNVVARGIRTIDDSPGPHLVIGSDRTHRAIGIVVFAAIGLAAGCSSSSSIDDASPAEAASESESDAGPIISGTSVTGSIDGTATPSLPTVGELLTNDRFVAVRVALERSDLDNVLDDLDDFVLLAPTGAAFSASETDIGIQYSTLMNDPRLLEAIMRYHIVADPSTNESWRTLNGSALDVDGTSADSIERVDGVDVLDSIAVRNGTVLVVPRLLLPTGSLITSTEPPRDE
jgi:uncharacterized surface protein with fasciclin (FAS1) repeats